MIELHKSWIPKDMADLLYDVAHSMPLEQRTIPIYGQQIPMPRLTGWCNDHGFGYAYSKQETPPIPWPNELKVVRDDLESFTGKKLPAVLINLYRHKDDSVGWHKDNEKWFKSEPFIASLTCGETRTFKMRNRISKESASFDLAHGDLLIFTDEHVLEWEHCITKAGKDVRPRVNFTFRTINT